MAKIRNIQSIYQDSTNALLRVDGSGNTILSWVNLLNLEDLDGGGAFLQVYNNRLIFPANSGVSYAIGSDSTDGSDNRCLVLSSSSQTDLDPTRGGCIKIHGNEYSGGLGSIIIDAGNANTSGSGIVLRTNSTCSIELATNSSLRWFIGSTGHLIPGSNITYDIGSSNTNRIRTVYGKQIDLLNAAGSIPLNVLYDNASITTLGSLFPTAVLASGGSSTPLLWVAATNGTNFASDIVHLESYRTSNDVYNFIRCVADADGTPVDIFRVRGDGMVEFSNVIMFKNNANAQILINTTDGNDNKTLSLTAGSSSGYTRGGSIDLYGNEHISNPGAVVISSGMATGALLLLTGSSSSNVDIIPNNPSGQTHRTRFRGSDGCLQYTPDYYKILADTDNGSDTKAVALCGGGDASSLRGAFVYAYGNENTSRGGTLALYAGNSSIEGIIDIRTIAAAAINFGTANTVRWSISSSGHFIPNINNVYNIGDTSYRVSTIYVDNIVSSTAGGSLLKLANNTSLKWRNAANNADINVLNVDTSDYTILNGSTSVYFQIDGTSRWKINSGGHLFPILDATYDIGDPSYRVRKIYAQEVIGAGGGFSPSGDIVYSNNPFQILADTSDGSDTKHIQISGGGAYGSNRGAGLRLVGNESTNAGNAYLYSGAVSGSVVNISSASPDGGIFFFAGNGQQRWYISSSGNLVSDATYGGNIIINASNTGITFKNTSQYLTFDNDFIVRSTTAYGSNTKSITICGGGSASVNQGAIVECYGNEHATYPGLVRILSGVTGGIKLYTQGSTVIEFVQSDSNNITAQFKPVGTNFTAVSEAGADGDIFKFTAKFDTITTNLTRYQTGLTVYSRLWPISSGIVDSGYRIGLRSEAYCYDVNFRGTLAQNIGLWARAGTHGTNPTGTITETIAVLAEVLYGANTTLTRSYGIYQTSEHTNTLNYFKNPISIGATSVPDSNTSLFLNSGDLVFAQVSAVIRTNTVDGSDNKTLIMTGGGNPHPDRGPSVYLYGNENSSGAGSILLVPGNLATGGVGIRFPHASATFQIQSGFGGGTTLLEYTQGGTLRFAQDADSEIRNSTSDGSDNRLLQLAAGGASNNSNRGSGIIMSGNEHGTYQGDLKFFSGVSAPNGIIFSVTGANRWVMSGTSLFPSADVQYDIGKSDMRVKTLYVQTIVGGGLQSGGLAPITNNTYLQWNSAESGTVDVLKVDTNDDTILNAKTGKSIYFTVNGSNTWYITSTGNLSQNSSTGGDIVFNKSSGIIRTGTVDSTDTGELWFTGGGSNSPTRGAGLRICGNENVVGAHAYLYSGDTSGAAVYIQNKSANGSIIFTTTASDLIRWSIYSSGHLVQDETNGNDIVMCKSVGIIRQHTIDGSDNKSLCLCGGGGASNTRGAYIQLYGNEHTSVGDLCLYAGVSSGQIKFYVDALKWTIGTYSSSSSLLAEAPAGFIGCNTTDGSDTAVLWLCGGPYNSNTRGGNIGIFGNENSTAQGAIQIRGGNTSTSHIVLQTNNSGAEIQIQTQQQEIWKFNSSGQFVQNETYGGNIVFKKTNSAICMAPASTNSGRLYICGGSTNSVTDGGVIRLDGINGSEPGTITIFGGGSSGIINFATNSQNRWYISTSGEIIQNATYGGDIVFNKTSPLIRQGTSDGADTGYIGICAGGGNGSNRGAVVELFGNENSSNPGNASILTGNVSGATLSLISYGPIVFNSGGQNTRYQITSGGNVVYYQSSTWYANTSDGADNFTFVLAGGGGSSTARGSSIQVCGNEYSSAGLLQLYAGDVASSKIALTAPNSSSTIETSVGTTSKIIQTNVSQKEKFHANYSGSENVRTTAAGDTTNGSPVLIWSLTLADNSTVDFSIRVVGRLNSTTVAKNFWAKFDGAVYRINNGNATFVGTPSRIYDESGTSAYDANVEVSGNNLRLVVTGAVSETVSWVAAIEYMTVLTAA